MTGLADIRVEIENLKVPIVPPWKVLGKKDSEIEKWFQDTLPVLEGLSEYRIQNHVNNLLWYAGDYDKTLEYRVYVPGQRDKVLARKVIPRIFNHLYDLTEQRVSKLSALKPDFEVYPTNTEEWRDKSNAKLIKMALGNMKRRVHMEHLMQELERWNAVFGEVFCSIEWNPKIGDKVSANSLERVGDVDVSLKHPWTWLPQPVWKREDVSWGIDFWKIMQVDEVRQVFKNNKIEPDGKCNIFSFNQDVYEKREDELVIYRIIYKPSEFLPKGNITYLANNKVIDVKDKYPYNHGEFPFEWHTDIDFPGRLFPGSAYQHIKPIQHMHNRLTSLISRNILLVGHPHILMPKGAAKIESFGNAPTAIEYNGQTKPEIATFPSVTKEIFDFRQMCRQEMEQVYGIQGVSRGAPPSGVRAASMLRFFEEQEQQRASTQIIKHNELIRRIYLKAASVITEYYPAGDKERLIRVVGKDNQYLVESLKGVKLSSEYDVIILNSTGFSESKAGRIEEIGFLQQMAPGLLSKEQIADILELGNTQKMYDITTVAIKTAETENEMFLDGKDVPPPTNDEDLIVHWRTHALMFNTFTWKTVIPEKNKEKARGHQKRTERLMEEKARVNASFAQDLAMLKGYPMFWTPTPALPEENKAASSAPADLQAEALAQNGPIPAMESGLLPQNLPPPEFLGGPNGQMPIA